MMLTKLGISSDERYFYVPNYKPPVASYDAEPFKRPRGENDAADMEAVRKKMLGRVHSIDKLIEKYRNVLSDDQVEGIEKLLNELKSKVRKLKLASTMEDVFIKAALRLRKEFGLPSSITKIAEGQGVDDFEEPSTPKAEIHERQANLKKIIEELLTVSHALKNRGLIRDLARIDLKLHGLNMASFFPEITDAQSKLIDAFSYASNKVDDVLPKLQGGLVMQEMGDQLEAGEKGAELAEEVKDLAKNVKVNKEQKKDEKLPRAPVKAPMQIPTQKAPAAPVKPQLAPEERGLLPLEIPVGGRRGI